MKKTYMTFFAAVCAMFVGIGTVAAQNSIDCGGTDYASAPSGSSLIANSTEISMTYWMYCHSNGGAPSYQGMAGVRNNVDADFYVIQLDGGSVEARFRNSSGTSFDIIGSGFETDVWQHYAFVYNGSQTKLYINGVMAGSVAASGSITSQETPFEIGRVFWGTDGFHLTGRLDELTLWSKALNEAEIQCLYTGSVDVASVGLQLYYPCNQGIAGANNAGITALTDAMGNVDATLNGFALNGATSNFQAGAAGYATTTDFYCPGTPYQFGSQTITSSGTFFETLTSAAGCDSIVQLVLYDALSADIIPITDGVACVQEGATYQWVNCDNGNSPIAGETGQWYLPTLTGNYAAQISNNGCTSLTSCLHVEVPVGTSGPLAGANVSVSPSPAQSFVLLNGTFEVGAARRYEVCNLQGQVLGSGVITSVSQRIDVTDLANGMYVLRVLDGHRTLQSLKVAVAR